jgi:hypothetical protein
MDEYYLLTRWVRRSVSNPAGALGGIIGSMNARTITCNVPPTWNVQNVLFELDLLSVKEIGNQEVGNLWRALLQEFRMILPKHSTRLVDGDGTILCRTSGYLSSR